jgi:hypothetical protein
VMSTININGRNMNAQALNAEAVSFTNLLARAARLDDPLPTGHDLSESEDKEIQAQVCDRKRPRICTDSPKIQAMYVLPKEAISLMWAAFCARHAGKLAKNLRELSLETQPKAFATYVQILSLLPEASHEPYYRIFLSSPESKQLPNIIGNAFAQGIQWRHPSGPGSICGLLIELLFWCDTTEGDDKKSSMDADVRKRVAHKTKLLKSSNNFQQLNIMQRADIERLDGVLEVIELMPGDLYLRSTREQLMGQVDCCGNEECDKSPTMRCAKCKSVGYCGRECQAKHWKSGRDKFTPL